MNIFNTQQIHGAKTGGMPGEALVDALGNQLTLDPETLKLLEQSSLENGVDFEKVLKATKEGKDPEAVIELLKNDKGSKLAKNALTEKQTNPTLTKESVLPEQINLKQTTTNNDLQNVLKLNKEQSVLPAEKNIETVEKKAFFPNQLKTTAAAKENTNSSAQLKAQSTMPLEQMPVKQNMQQAVKANPYQAQSSQSIIGQKEVGKEVAKKNNLLNLNQFMAKQSPSVQKNAATKAYRPLNNSMFDKKVQDSLPGVVKKPTTATNEMKMQDILLGKNEVSTEMQSKVMEGQNFTTQNVAKETSAGQTAKVFNLNTINQADTTAEIITKVQDYIVQSKAVNQQQVEMSFNHQELGKVDLLVQKAHGDQLNIAIGTNSVEASKFFAKNQADLLGTLAQSGIQVGEFKLEPSQGSNNQSLSQDSSKQQFAGDQKGQHGSQSGQRDQESRKREELWNQFYDKDVA